MRDTLSEAGHRSAVSGLPRPVLIAGVGSADADDAAGLVVARRLRKRLSALQLPDVHVVETDDPATLLARWGDMATAVIVDAARTGHDPGSVARWQAGDLPDAKGCSFVSTHAFGVFETIALARQLGTLPPRLIVYGIEAGPASRGSMSKPVQGAISAVVAELFEVLVAMNSIA